MQLTTIFTSLVLAASSVAASPSGWGNWGGNGGNNGGNKACSVSQTNLNDLINGYTYILTKPGGPNFNTTANRILDPAFTVLSDSINSLAGRPLGSLSFPPGRQAFIDSQYLTPPIPVLQTLDVFVSGDCSKLSWRWLATGIGSNQYEVKGIIDADLTAGPKGGDAYVLKTVYSEFNTAAWLRNYGVQCVTPPR